MDNIYQRVNAIQQSVGYVKKDADVGFGNAAYKAVTHDAVMSKLREQLVEKKIVVVPHQRDLGATQKTGETTKGKDWILFRALYDIHYVCADNPTDFLVVSVEGHGEDQNDKADGKALSYACKSAHLKLFLLATGENDEERVETDNVSKSQPRQNNRPPADPANTATADMARELKDELLALTSGNVEEATTRLKELTVFGDAQDKWMKYDQIDQCSEKWLKQTLAKVKKLPSK